MKIKYFILIALFGFLMSCSDSYLEDLSTTSIKLDDNAIRTRTDVENTVKGIYAKMMNPSGIASDHMTYQELSADLGFVSTKNSGYFVGTNGGTQFTPEGGGSGLWSSMYSTIALCNFLLSFEGKIKDDGKGTQTIEQLFSHARAVRAYNYYVLLTYFSPNYGEGDQSLGLPYPTQYDINAKLPRTPVATVVNNIINDLNLALINPPIGVTKTDKHNSFNDIAIRLLLAKVYLYKKDYPHAIQYAQQVYDDGASVLLPRNQVGSFFTVNQESNPEILFQIEMNPTSNNGLSGISGYWGFLGDYYKQNYMTRAFWNTFPTTSDIRCTTWYVNSASLNAATPGDIPSPIDIRKYNNVERDVVILRKTESVFILAEAQYQTNPSSASTTLTNWVKGYRQTNYVAPATTGPAVLDEILRQKGFEFFLEGHRFADLKRNNRPIIKPQTGLNIPVGDKRFLWAIPLNEIQTNPQVVQNPGY